jgi:hypothetical protein
MTTATKTISHDEIRQWAEQRGGKPARVAGTGSAGDAGLLRINFDEPGGDDDDRLEEISWEDWFKAFDANKLAFLHQDESESGKESRFNKLVSRDD